MTRIVSLLLVATSLLVGFEGGEGAPELAPGFTRVPFFGFIRLPCKANAHWEDCVKCHPTCDNPVPQLCEPFCIERCVCDKGYIKDYKYGNCIRVEDCPHR